MDSPQDPKSSRVTGAKSELPGRWRDSGRVPESPKRATAPPDDPSTKGGADTRVPRMSPCQSGCDSSCESKERVGVVH